MFNELTMDELMVVDGGRRNARGMINFIEDAIWSGIIFEVARRSVGAVIDAVGEKAKEIFVESIKTPIGL